MRPRFAGNSYLTLTRKNRVALESGTLYGEVAPLTSAYGPVTLLADCKVPARVLVLLPPLPVVTISLFVKLAALVGAKRTTRLVPPKPDKAKGVPETIVNGPALTVATPFVSAAPPRLVTTKLA